MKLIQVTEAAKRLGVSRQTLENWGKYGVLKIRSVGNGNKSHWVDADTIDALGDSIKDVARAQCNIERLRDEVLKEETELRNRVRELRHDIIFTNKVGAICNCEDFYLTIPDMMHELTVISSRECEITKGIIRGETTEDLSEAYGLSRTRIRQIYYKVLRKFRYLEQVRQCLSENIRLNKEVESMRADLRLLNRELNIQREEERRLAEMEEEERIKYITEHDRVLKLYATRLVDCNISVRSLNCLKSLDIDTIGDLCKASKTDLLKARNFGKKSLSELDDFLDSKGLTFGTDVDAIRRERIAQIMSEGEINS